MSSFLDQKRQYLDNNGDPLAAGTIQFYDSGTTTPVDTYSDRARTSANSNPLVLDANGRIQSEVWLDPDYSYTVVVKDSGGTTIKTTDNVWGIVTNNELKRRQGIGLSPLDYDATAGGGADASTEVLAALAVATGVLDLEGLIFRCDSIIDVPDTGTTGLTIRNGTFDFSSGSGYLRVKGSEGSALALNSDAAVGATTLDMTDVSGLAVGDLIRLYDSTQSQMIRIAAISGTTLTLRGRVLYSFTTANSASIKKVTTLGRVVFEDLKIISDGSADSYGILVESSDDVTIRNVRAENCIALARVYRSAAVRIEDVISTPETGAIGSRRLVMLEDAYDVTIDGAFVYGCDLMVHHTGEGAGYKFSNITGHQVNAIASFGSVKSPVFADCTFDMQPEGSALDDAILLSSGGGLVLDNVEIKGAADLGVQVINSATNGGDVVISGCRISGDDTCITATLADGDRLIVNGCVLEATSNGKAVSVDTVSAALTAYAAITGNTCQVPASARSLDLRTSGAGVLYAAVGSNVSVKADDTDNNIDIAGGAASGISIAVTGNVLVNGAYGVDISNGGTTIHDGNSFVGMGTSDTNGTFTREGDTTDLGGADA